MTQTVPQKKTPTTKDVAEFFRLGITQGLVPVQDAVAWADAIVEREASPPEWALELSMASKRPEEAVSHLGTVPGETTGTLPLEMLFCIARRRVSEGKLKTRTVVKMVKLLENPNADAYVNGLIACRDAFESVDAGQGTEDEADRQVVDYLQPFANLDEVIPQEVEP